MAEKNNHTSLSYRVPPQMQYLVKKIQSEFKNLCLSNFIGRIRIGYLDFDNCVEIKWLKNKASAEDVRDQLQGLMSPSESMIFCFDVVKRDLYHWSIILSEFNKDTLIEL